MTLQLNPRDVTIPVPGAVDRPVVSVRPSAPTTPVVGAGASLPAAAAVAAQAAHPPSAELAQAVEQVNRKLIESNVDLHFRIDDATHETVVSLIDRKSGDILRQFPSEEALKFAHALVLQRGTLIAGTA